MTRIRKPANYRLTRHTQRMELCCTLCGDEIGLFDYYFKHSDYKFHLRCFGECLGIETVYWWSVI